MIALTPRLLLLSLVLSACDSAAAPNTPATTPATNHGASAGSGTSASTTPASMPLAGFGAENPGMVTMPMPSHDMCNKLEIDFAPRIPSVFILVDRSGSMFEHNLWEPLKVGVLAVIEQLAGEIRFGPQLSEVVPLAQQNYAAIKQAYDAIQKPQFKAETPTSAALDQVSKILQSEPEDRPKYVLLVTDGEPDFCDDPNVTCSRDAVVNSAQAAFSLGIGTFIVSVGGEVDRGHLGDVANAGTGQPVEDRQMAVHYQCPTTMAHYSDSSGNAPFFEPDVNDRDALVATLANTIAGVRSCVFDLNGKVQIDLTMADQGLVAIDGKRIPYGGADGYRMNSATQLELLGTACQDLREPATKRVSIDFPCQAIQPL
jgi:von Willebrand factor type A domain